MLKAQPTSRLSRRLLPAAALSLALLLGCTETEDDPHTCPSDGQQILLTSPNGGETFKIGDTLRVKWKLCNNGSQEISSVDPFLSPDDGKTWCYMKLNSIPVGDASFGNYAWKIPDSIGLQGEWFQLKDNAKCRVKVEQYSTINEKQRSISKATFTVK
jgi:hypothetical protein